MSKTSKRMKAVYEGVNKEELYTLTNAVKEVVTRSKVKFDETVEVSMRLNVDPKQADQNLRGMISLPNGTGKTCKVAVFAKTDAAKAAKDAGADLVGDDDLINKIANGEINFDRCIATPDMMPALSKVARVLGPKGLMPNPKLGTVTPNVGEAVKKAKEGQVEYRVEKNGIIHVGAGKVSFGEKKLEENIRNFISVITKAKPSSVKGTFLKGISISSSMGAGFKIDLADVN